MPRIKIHLVVTDVRSALNNQKFQTSLILSVVVRVLRGSITPSIVHAWQCRWKTTAPFFANFCGVLF